MAGPTPGGKCGQGNSLSATVRQYKEATDTLLRWLFATTDIEDPSCREIYTQIHHKHRDPNKQRPSKAVRRACKIAIEKRLAVNKFFEKHDSEISTEVNTKNQQHRYFSMLLQILQEMLIDPWQEDSSRFGNEIPVCSLSIDSTKTHAQNTFAVLEEVFEDEPTGADGSLHKDEDAVATTNFDTLHISAPPQKPNRNIMSMRLSEFDDRDIVVAILEEMQQMMYHFDYLTVPSIRETDNRQSPMLAVLVANVMYTHLRAQTKRTLARLDKCSAQMNLLVTEDLLACYGFDEAGAILAETMVDYKEGIEQCSNMDRSTMSSTADGEQTSTPDTKAQCHDNEDGDGYLCMSQRKRVAHFLCQYISQEYAFHTAGMEHVCNIFIRDLQNAVYQSHILDKLVVIFGVALFASLESMIGSDPFLVDAAKEVLRSADDMDSKGIGELLDSLSVQKRWDNSGRYPQDVATYSYTYSPEPTYSGRGLSFWEIGLELIRKAALMTGEILTILRNPCQDRTAFKFVAKVLYLQIQGAKIRHKQFDLMFRHLATLFFEDRSLPGTVDELNERWQEFVAGAKAAKLGQMRAERAIRNPALSVVHMLVSSSFIIDADITDFLLNNPVDERNSISGIGALCFSPFPRYKPANKLPNHGSNSPEVPAADAPPDPLQDPRILETELRVRSLRGYEGFSIIKILEPLERALRQQLYFGFCPLTVRAVTRQAISSSSMDKAFKISLDGSLYAKRTISRVFAQQCLNKMEEGAVTCISNTDQSMSLLYPRLYFSHNSIVRKGMVEEGIVEESASRNYLVFEECLLEGELARYKAEYELMMKFEHATEGLSCQTLLTTQSRISNVVAMVF